MSPVGCRAVQDFYMEILEGLVNDLICCFSNRLRIAVQALVAVGVITELLAEEVWAQWQA